MLLQEHFVGVTNNQEFCLLPPAELGVLLASDDINVHSEETIFHALITWTQHDTTNRKQHLADLLEHVRLPLLSPQVIIVIVQLQVSLRSYIMWPQMHLICWNM